MGRVELIHENLSYKIRGILYKVHNEIGQYRNEKQYCDALENEFRKEKMNFEREKVLDISFDGEKKGRNKLDFLIENKIIIEVKAVEVFTKNDYFQCKRYLVSSQNIKLCLLVNFRSRFCIIKRIINPNLHP